VTFCDALIEHGVQLHRHDAPISGAVDACYVCDPVLMTPMGFIELQMGKSQRRVESQPLADFLSTIGISRLGTIVGQGTVEGGDCFWLNERTLLVGENFRTNAEGIAQLRALLPGFQILEIPMPWCNGPDECLHLQSFVSFASPNLALVHMPFAPIRLIHALEQQGIKCLRCPASEYSTLACNFLCTAPNRVIMVAGNPLTANLLRNNGVDVTEVQAPDLMVAGTGGPTCLTLPVRRTEIS